MTAAAAGPPARARRRAVLARGPRVLLVRPCPDDRTAFLAMVRASRAHHRPWVTPPATAAAFAAYLARSRRRNHKALLALDGADGTIAGVFNLSEIVRGSFQSAYLGYYGSARHEGRGLMTEALGLVLRHAFLDLGLHRVEANIQPGNRRSIALVKRLGFAREGYSPRYLKIGLRWRDHERWAITRESWQGAARGAATQALASSAATRSRSRSARSSRSPVRMR